MGDPMSSVVISGDTSGSVTLDAPAISGNTVLTLPTTSGTILTTAGGATVPFALGSASTPSITFTGDTNTGIFSPTADTIAFAEGGAEVARFDSAGNLGIGTSGPTQVLDIVRGSGDPAIRIQSAGGAYFIVNRSSGQVELINAANQAMLFGTNNTERMRIDSAGRVTMSAQPAFFAGIGAVSDATFNLNQFLPYNQTVLNTGGFFNTSTNRFTAPVAGRYFFSWNTFYTDSGGLSNDMQTGLNVNGSYISFSGGDAFVNVARPSTSGVICIGCSAVVNLAANDVVGIMARTNNVRVYQGHCNFSGYLVG